MIMHANFWPLDFDEEVEIYDSPSWNLPGRRKQRLQSRARDRAVAPRSKAQSSSQVK
jgi:hypothetical protein